MRSSNDRTGLASRRVRTALLCIVSVLSACGRNTVFYERDSVSGANVAALFYDKVGDLYPPIAIVVDSQFLDAYPDVAERLTLRGYFKRKAHSAAPSWKALVAETRIPSTLASNFPAAWRAIQDTLVQRNVTAIRARARRSDHTQRTLFITVHGFNNDRRGANSWYPLVHTAVAEYMVASQERRGVSGPVDPVFLDVYWDALTSSAPPVIWRNAQYNFPLIGLEFRRVLNQLDPSMPIRVFTHSTGGPLIANTLGNASAPFRGSDSLWDHYYEHIGDSVGTYKPAPSKDFRVAMIVPAASPNTFDNFGMRSARLDRLIIGINPADYAIAKSGFGCKALGSTCLSADRYAFCNAVAPVFAKDPRTKAYLFDFSTWRWKPGFDAHNIPAYLARDDMPRVLNLLLDDDATDPGEAEKICGKA